MLDCKGGPILMQKSQNPFEYYLCLLGYTVLALVVRVAAFAPLAALFAFSGSPLQLLALLCPALLLFVVLPLRFSFADAMVDEYGRRCFSFGRAFSFAHYGEKLKEAFIHALSVLKWGIPVAALCAVAYHYYTNVDALTVLGSITELGKGFNSLYVSVANVFGAGLAPSMNTLMDGVAAIGLIVALAVLIWLYGAARNSATRHIWVMCEHADRPLRPELRRRMRGRRFAQLGVALLNLLLCVPFVLVMGMLVKPVVSDAASMLMMAVMSGSLPALDLAGLVAPVISAFVVLYLMVLPIRRWIVSAFAVRERAVRAAKA